MIARYFASGRTIGEGTSARVAALEDAERMARERAKLYGVGTVWGIRLGVAAVALATFYRDDSGAYGT